MNAHFSTMELLGTISLGAVGLNNLIHLHHRTLSVLISSFFLGRIALTPEF